MHLSITQADFDAVQAAAHGALPAGAFGAAWAAGRELSPQAAVTRGCMPSTCRRSRRSRNGQSGYRSPVALGPQLEEVLDDPAASEGLAVVPPEALIYMKLKASRRQDLLDVVKLINAGADVRRVRLYLEQHTSDLVTMFDGLVEEALEGQ